MLWLGVDFETTGLNVKEDRIIEVGAVLWDTIRKRPLTILNELVWDDTYPELPSEVVSITGITEDDLKKYGRRPLEVLCALLAIAGEADLLVAHNGTNFDKPLLEAELERVGAHPSEPLEWIDSSVDVPYPESVSTRKLTHLAAEHGFVNPFAHRAVFDVLTMLHIMSKYDAKEILALSKSPSITIRAVVTFAEKEQARTRGYRWNAEQKWWVKTVKEVNLEKEMTAPFKIQILEDGRA